MSDFIENILKNDNPQKMTIQQQQKFIVELLEYFGNNPSFLGILNSGPSKAYNLKWIIEQLQKIYKTDDVDKEISRNSDFWNESVQKLYEIWNNYWGQYGANYTITRANDKETESSVEFRIESDVEKADAGMNFIEDGNWVTPNLNIDGNTYKEVRDSDVNIYAGISSENLQFTKKSGGKWIRLIMPQFSRRVQIEDLNRNFWVIGENMSIISSFLFDKNSPLIALLNGLTSEFTQLWDATLMAWLLLLLGNQKIINSHIHYELVYLPNNELENFRSFTNFEQFIDDSSGDENDWRPALEEKISSRLGYLIDKYPNEHLCILVCIREKNYQKNYYARASFPYLLFYDRDKDSGNFQFISLKDSSNGRGILSFSITDEKSRRVDGMSAIKFMGKFNSVGYPFSKIDKKQEPEPKRYYGLLRIRPQLEITKSKGEFILRNFTFTLFDVGRFFIDGTYNIFEKYTLGDAEAESEYIITDQLEGLSFNRDIKWQTDAANYYGGQYGEKGEKTFFRTIPARTDQPYYMGEMVTDYIMPDISITYESGGTTAQSISTPLLFKIGNFIPQREIKSKMSVTEQVTGTNKSQVKKDNTTGYLANLTVNHKIYEGTAGGEKKSGYSDRIKVDNNDSPDLFFQTLIKKDYSNSSEIQISGSIAKEIPFTYANAWTAWAGTDNSKKKILGPSSSEYINNYQKKQTFLTYLNETMDQDLTETTNPQKGIYDYQAISLNRLKKIGIRVLKDYIEKNAGDPETMRNIYQDYKLFHKDQIVYILCVIGICAWDNGAQGYWETNLLTHLFRFFPADFGNQLSEEDIYDSVNSGSPSFSKESDYNHKFFVCRERTKNKNIIGYLQYLTEINKGEHNFSICNYVRGTETEVYDYDFRSTTSGNRWRLPYLVCEEGKGGYYTLKRNKGGVTQELYLPLTQEMLEYSDEQLFAYAQSHPELLKENKDELNSEIYRELSKEFVGSWRMFNGYVESTKNNLSLYPGGTFAQQIQMDFKGSQENNFNFVISSPIQYRPYLNPSKLKAGEPVFPNNIFSSVKTGGNLIEGTQPVNPKNPEEGNVIKTFDQLAADIWTTEYSLSGDCTYGKTTTINGVTIPLYKCDESHKIDQE